MSSAVINFSPQHPALAGHFPGNPIIPGVMILDLVLNYFLEKYPNDNIAGFNYVKFIKPLAPQESLNVTLTSISSHRVGFTCCKGTDIYVKGEISLQQD